MAFVGSPRGMRYGVVGQLRALELTDDSRGWRRLKDGGLPRVHWRQ